jgi:outer membrane protein assembly factor BamB
MKSNYPENNGCGRMTLQLNASAILSKIYLSSILRAIILPAAIIVTIIIASLAEGGQLISPRQMERFGLVRIWYNQLAVDAVGVKLRYLTLEGDTLFAVSSDAKLHAINTTTGKLLWSKVMGKRALEHYAPAVNSRIVAVVNNIELFVFDRKNGQLLLYTLLPNSVATTACEVSENYVYIPMQGGRIIAYPLEDGIAEKVFNIKTGQYEYANAVKSKPPIPTNQPEDAENKKTPNKADAMKVNVSGDLASRDAVIADIVEGFAQTKYSILAKPEVPPKEPQLVLKPALNFPMSTISFGDLSIQPKLSTQVFKYDPADNALRMHWEILAWVDGNGDFHTSVIRDLSQTKIDQLYKVSSPTKIFKPELNQIAERDWKIDKQVVVRPATNQTVPYFYSGVNFGHNTVQDLSVLGTKSGYVYAIKNRNGEIAWHFVGNGAITEQIGVIGIDVFAATDKGMYDIDLLTGKMKWYSPNIHKFICASQDRVYVKDRHDYLVILARRSGARLATLDLRKFRDVLFNIETDRLFIVDNSGLIQCFAERSVEVENNNLRSGLRSMPELRHRLSASQYVEVTRGKEIEDLYWVKGLGYSGKATEEDKVKSKDSITEIPVTENHTTDNSTANSGLANETNNTETTTDVNNTPDQTTQEIPNEQTPETTPPLTDDPATETDQPTDKTPDTNPTTPETPTTPTTPTTPETPPADNPSEPNTDPAPNDPNTPTDEKPEPLY